MDEYTREVAEEIARRRDIPIEHALRIVEAAHPLWQALEPLTDAYGGMEFCRVFPDAIDFIHRLSNPLCYPETTG
jgi:hypothetical protein